MAKKKPTSIRQRRRWPPHISRIDQPRFFASAFGGIRPARDFYQSLRGTEDKRRHNALLIINQTARMLWLADRVHSVSRGRPALQILFFMFAAEAVAKLFAGYTGEGDSKKHAVLFFLSICSDNHRRRLVSALGSKLGVGSSPMAIARRLYAIRCDVAHRWNYYGLHLPNEVVRELRAIVLEGAAIAAQTLVATEKSE